MNFGSNNITTNIIMSNDIYKDKCDFFIPFGKRGDALVRKIWMGGGVIIWVEAANRENMVNIVKSIGNTIMV